MVSVSGSRGGAEDATGTGEGPFGRGKAELKGWGVGALTSVALEA